MRVDPIEPGTRPTLAALEQQITAQRGRVSPLYQVLLNSPPIAQGWEQMLSAVRNRSSLPADLRELAILRVAVLNRAHYEFDAHRLHAQHAGLSDTAIAAVRHDAPLEQHAWTDTQGVVLRLTDAMTRRIEVDDALYDAVRKRFDAQAQVDLVATIAAYNMVSRFLVALQIGH